MMMMMTMMPFYWVCPFIDPDFDLSNHISCDPQRTEWNRDPSEILQGPDGCFEWSDGDVWQRDGEMEETHQQRRGECTPCWFQAAKKKAVDHMKTRMT